MQEEGLNTATLLPWLARYSKSWMCKVRQPLVKAIEAAKTTYRIRPSAARVQGPIQLVQNPHDRPATHLFAVAIQMQLVGIGPVGVGL